MVSKTNPPECLVVMGLGNPGRKYAHTRHNAGYRAVMLLRPEKRFRRPLFTAHARLRIAAEADGRDLVLTRFTGFMNRSGEAVPELVRLYGVHPKDILVVVDNMDLPPGSCRLKMGGGDAGHRGLRSIMQFMDGAVFPRLYIGVGRPDAGRSVVDHVLGEPEGEQERMMNEGCLRASRAIRNLSLFPFHRVADELNRRQT